MASTATVTIAFPNPNHIVFSGTTTRVHPHGHLWLVNDSNGVVINFEILTAGYTFNDGGVGNPKQAFFTSSNPNPVAFDPCGGEFTNLMLLAGNTEFSVTVANANGQKYFYQFNFIEPTGALVSTTDPIIVNRG
jgi:hypothetical protein